MSRWACSAQRPRPASTARGVYSDVLAMPNASATCGDMNESVTAALTSGFSDTQMFASVATLPAAVETPKAVRMPSPLCCGAVVMGGGGSSDGDGGDGGNVVDVVIMVVELESVTAA